MSLFLYYTTTAALCTHLASCIFVVLYLLLGMLMFLISPVKPLDPWQEKLHIRLVTLSHFIHSYYKASCQAAKVSNLKAITSKQVVCDKHVPACVHVAATQLTFDWVGFTFTLNAT